MAMSSRLSRRASQQILAFRQNLSHSGFNQSLQTAFFDGSHNANLQRKTSKSTRRSIPHPLRPVGGPSAATDSLLQSTVTQATLAALQCAFSASIMEQSGWAWL